MNKAKFVVEIKVKDPDSGGKVELSVFKHEFGGMFAMDSSFIEQVIGGDDDTDKVVIPDPFEKGFELELQGI